MVVCLLAIYQVIVRWGQWWIWQCLFAGAGINQLVCLANSSYGPAVWTRK